VLLLLVVDVEVLLVDVVVGVIAVIAISSFARTTSSESPGEISVKGNKTPSYIIHLAFSYVGHVGQTSAVRMIYKFKNYCCTLGCVITFIPISLASSGSIKGSHSLSNCDVTGIRSRKYLTG